MRINSVIKNILLSLCLLFGAAIALADTASMRYLTSVEKTQYHLHSSKLLQHDYHLFVLAPEELEPNVKYATVYLLDGGITYPLLAAYSRYLRLAEEIPPIIIVGISYGADDFRNGNKRSTDFTAPASSREYYGGAEKFQTMLNQEIFPFIEQRYPSDKSKRILFGQSIGGQFALYNALFNRNSFFGLIASNPALHRNLDFFLQSNEAQTSEEAKPLLFLSLAENDDARFKIPAEKWLKHWQEKESKPFELNFQRLDDHNHFSAAPEAFRNGLRWFLGANQ